VRLSRLTLLLCSAMALGAADARGEYVVLRSGQRLSVTSYQLQGDKYTLQVAGGSVEVSAADVVRIEPEEVFTPVKPDPSPQGPFAELIKAASVQYGVDENLIASVIAAESNFDPHAISRRNARGLMQLLPETAARFAVRDIFDPKENIEAGTRYLSELLKRYKNDLALALGAYNAGPEKVEKFGSVPPYAETVSYVRRVKRELKSRKPGSSTGPGGPNRSASGATPAGSKLQPLVQ